METVFVGLSGGVDSAVSAALVKKQGFSVVGAFIKIWSPEFLECTWERDRLDAMRVAATLGIPFLEVNLSDEYRRTVIDDMVESYGKGVTPNPDVLCNRFIKFGAFAQWAFSMGATRIATGHYAQVKRVNDRYMLERGADAAKDQSYFLWQLGDTELSKVLFPVGNLMKGKVRSLAHAFGLPVAKKSDSQGLCFVGDVTISEFLSNYLPMKPGDVLDLRGTVIGKHSGAAAYTVGQRHGFTLSDNSTKPLYVIEIDTTSNTIRVSERPESAAQMDVRLEGVHLHVSRDEIVAPVDIQARYHEKPVRAQIRFSDSQTEVMFEQPHIVTPGQSLVFYSGNLVLGGGIVARRTRVSSNQSTFRSVS